jgi:RNA polymerase sigma-70 factor, ECF subfamily
MLVREMTESSQHLTTHHLDREDIRQVRSGNPQAFAGIVNRYTDQIYNLAVRSLGDRDSAEEAVQDVFLKAYRSIESFDHNRPLFPWLYSIAINHLRSLQRRATRRHDANTVPLVEELVPAESPTVASLPETELLARSARAVVEHALSELKPMQRQAFVLRHLRDLSTADAARLMNINENTLKTHLSRARKRLQKILGSYGITGADT